MTETFTAVPLVFDAGVLNTLRAAAGRQGIQLAPAGMLFVPCVRGISHHPDESATPADPATGARALAEALAELANR